MIQNVFQIAGLNHKEPEWNGITEAELFALSAIDAMDDAFIGLAISDSRSAALTPDAIMKESYIDIAKKAGYDDVWEYMRPMYNVIFAMVLAGQALVSFFGMKQILVPMIAAAVVVYSGAGVISAPYWCIKCNGSRWC